MIIPDVNLLLYAHFAQMPHHERARQWWERTLSEARDVAIPTVVVFGFVRLGTSARVFDVPMTVSVASETVTSWLSRDNARVLLPGTRHVELTLELLAQAGTGGNLTTDAQLAALAIEHQAELYSNNTDFGRFNGLRWRNPLA